MSGRRYAESLKTSGAGAFEEIVEPMRSEDFWVPGEALAREHARSGL